MTAGGLARSDSGNFVLTEIELGWSEAEQPLRPVRISEAEATFEQMGHDVAHAFDGKPETGWAVHRGRPVRQDHAAVFRFAAPVVTRWRLLGGHTAS